MQRLKNKQSVTEVVLNLWLWYGGNMKYTFEEEDIKVGMFVTHKNSSEISVLSWDADRKDKTVKLTQINTDGMILFMGDTAKKVAEHLNEHKYIPITNRRIAEYFNSQE